MRKTTPCPYGSHPLIVTRRSCPGCGLCPGKLHSTGLCLTCQHPDQTGRRGMGADHDNVVTHFDIDELVTVVPLDDNPLA